MRKQKPAITLLVIVITLAIVLASSGIVFADSYEGTNELVSEITVNGLIEVSQIMIRVTHPASVGWTVDSQSNLVATDLTVTNNSIVPVNVTVSSFKSNPTGGAYPLVDVLPNAYDWNLLSPADTEKYIAVGLSRKEGGWGGTSPGTYWSASNTQSTLGHLNTGGSGVLSISDIRTGKTALRSIPARHKLEIIFSIKA